MNTLFVVSTPIGNLEDITIRAIKVLLTTNVIACEDTRKTGQLIKILRDKYAQPLGILSMFKPKYLSIRDWNEAEMVGMLLKELKDWDVALVSDAGTPLISDPGFKVVRAAREAGFKVSPVPGPTAAMAALSASGLPTNNFVFWGFLGKKWELTAGMTNIIYESPVRSQETVLEIKKRYPEAKIVIAQELTKIHEAIGEFGLGTEFKGEVAILVFP